MILLRLLAVVAVIYVALSIFVGPRRAWQLWRRFGHALGDAVARVLMTVFYFTVIVPFALIAKIYRDPLGEERPTDTLWLTHAEPVTDLDAARRQH